MSQESPPHSSSSGVEAIRGPDATAEPTRVRYGVLAFLAVMTFVLYLDRTCIGQAAPMIQKDLNLSNWNWSIVLNAFALAYAVFEIPAGRWGDRFGSRGVLTRIVVWWSFFTAMTGAAGGFMMLVAIRFLFGAGEAGALPNAARVLREWFPDSSRGRASGLVAASMLLGGAAAPLASQWLMDQVGWRWTFVIFAVCGVVWAIAFYVWFRDNPAEHPATNEAERRLIGEGRKLVGDPVRAHGPIPWKQVVNSPDIWLLSVLIGLSSGMYELFSAWYPKYLQSAAGPTRACRASSPAWCWAPGPAPRSSEAGSPTGWSVGRATIDGAGRPSPSWVTASRRSGSRSASGPIRPGWRRFASPWRRSASSSRHPRGGPVRLRSAADTSAPSSA